MDVQFIKIQEVNIYILGQFQNSETIDEGDCLELQNLIHLKNINRMINLHILIEIVELKNDQVK